ncbi:MAG: hypothetical protein ACP5O0_11635, partial [Acidimicrobiales bacterium]
VYTDDTDGHKRGDVSEAPAEKASAALVISRARIGYQLLRSWRVSPGLVDDRIDEEKIRAWLDAVRMILSEKGRFREGLYHFGHVLAFASAGTDGVCPSEVVRDVIEELTSGEVERGYEDGVLNRRGVTARPLGEGGSQEAELSLLYRLDADRLCDVWPRSAAILRRVADFYDTDARRNDELAEQLQQHFG